MECRKKEVPDFSGRVKSAIKSIPRGRVATYGQIAKMAGNPRAVRAVVWILHSSSGKHGLPWHRVINSKGVISLKPNAGFEEQVMRLVDEGVRIGKGGKIDLKKYQWKDWKTITLKLTMSDKPDHLGHRKRLREKFLNSGADALHDYELVELLLAYAIPRRDVKPAAKALLERFGSLQGLLDADPSQVAKVPGVGLASAVLVKLVKEIHCRSLARDMKGSDALSSPKAVLDFARTALAGQGSECFLAIFLNAKNRVLDQRIVHEGTIDHAIVYPRRIIEQALAARAAGLILVHNHPSGDPTPSDEDRRLTKSIQDAARPLDIRVLDHIIVGREGYCSFAEKDLL